MHLLPPKKLPQFEVRKIIFEAEQLKKTKVRSLFWVPPVDFFFWVPLSMCALCWYFVGQLAQFLGLFVLNIYVKFNYKEK